MSKKRQIEYEPNKCTINLLLKEDKVFSVEIKKFGLKELKEFFEMKIMASNDIVYAQEMSYILSMFSNLESTDKNHVWYLNTEDDLHISLEYKYNSSYDDALSAANDWLDKLKLTEIVNATVQ